MGQYRVRSVAMLRERMAKSQRVVPHSVRSLAALVGASRTTVGCLLTGERPTIDERLAQRIAVALGVPVDDLFLPEPSSSEDKDERRAS